jgi:hypothetical protein
MLSGLLKRRSTAIFGHVVVQLHSRSEAYMSRRNKIALRLIVTVAYAQQHLNSHLYTSDNICPIYVFDFNAHIFQQIL